MSMQGHGVQMCTVALVEWSETGNRTNVHQRTRELADCGISMHWNAQQSEGVKANTMIQDGNILQWFFE